MSLYLDYNATTPLHPEVKQAMAPFWEADFGNPSSLHQMGQRIRSKIDAARQRLEVVLDAGQYDLCFTSGATESNNLALQGLAQEGRLQNKMHAIVSAIEHPSVAGVAQVLESQGFDVTYLNPNAAGVIEIEALREAIQPDTAWASVMHANNETGAIQPIFEIASLLKEKGIQFHVDAAQSFGKIPFSLNVLDCDALSLSAHKFYGPKGIGLLAMRKRLKLKPLFHGGHQENNLRPGTENPGLIIGMARAAELAKKNLTLYREKYPPMRESFIKAIQEALPDVVIHGETESTLPTTVNLRLAGALGTSVLMNLDLKGICVSTGSACAAGSAEASPTLLAMGLSEEEALSSLRISFGEGVEANDLAQACSGIQESVNRIRNHAR